MSGGASLFDKDDFDTTPNGEERADVATSWASLTDGRELPESADSSGVVDDLTVFLTASDDTRPITATNWASSTAGVICMSSD